MKKILRLLPLALVLTAIFFAAPLSAAPTLGWQWVNPAPQGNTLYRYGYLGNGRHIVIGTAGTVGTSTDGRTWTYHTIPMAGRLTDVAAGKDKIVVVGWAGIFVSGDGGQTWHGTSGDDYQQFNSVIYAGGRFLAYSGGLRGVSTDGENWTYDQVTADAGYLDAVDFYDVVYTGAQFVAAGWDTNFQQGVIYTSNDGQHWKIRFSADAAAFYGVSFGGGRVVAVGANNQCAVSTDGVTWTAGTVMPGDDAPSFFGLAYRNGQFLASGSAGALAVSTDGVTWSALNSGVTDNLPDVGAGPDGFYLTGANGTLLRSTDTVSFPRVDGRRSFVASQPSLYSLRAVDDRLYVAGAGGSIAYTTNGTDYTAVTSGTVNDLWCLIRQGGTLYVAGDGGTIRASVDGVTWSARTTGTSSDLRSLAFLNNQFIAAGADGTLLTSPDGVHWTSRTTDVTGTIYGVAYGNGLYLAVGSDSNGNGQMATSADGITWAPQESVAGGPFHGVVFYGGLFTAVGEQDAIYQSANGTDWSAAPINRTPGSYYVPDVYDIRILDGRYYGVSFGAGTTGYESLPICFVVTSGDGVHWTQISQITDHIERSVELFKGRLYTCGDAGTVLQSDPVTPLAAPALVTGLSDQTARQGDQLNWSVTTDSTGITTYEWRKDGTVIAGATGPFLRRFNVQLADAGSYAVTVSNTAGSVTSTALLTIDGQPVAPTITGQPVPQSLQAGGPATFAVTAKGTAPFSYQWRKNGANISAATGPTLTLNNVQPANAAAYSVAITNTAGTTVSDSATLAVYLNDNFANRTTLSGTNVVASGSNVGGTKEDGEPNHGGYAGGASVWWTWTAPTTGVVTLDLTGTALLSEGTAADAAVGVYTGSTVSALTTVPTQLTAVTPGRILNFNAKAGTVYQIAVDGDYNSGVGDITLHLTLSALPANDNFAARQRLTGSTATVITSSIGATEETNEPNHAGDPGGASLWWTWTAPASGTVTLDLTGTDMGGAPTLVGVYTGTTLANLVKVAANLGFPGGVSFAATSGTTYQIAIDGDGGASGAIKMSLTSGPVVANNNFAARATLSGTNVTVTGTNVGANKEAGEPYHAGDEGGHSVWWTWTAPSSGRVVIDLAGTTMGYGGTLLAVYTGSTYATLNEVASDWEDPTSRVVFTAVSGTVYQIAVDGAGGVSGSIVLSLTLAPFPANDLFANRTTLRGASVAVTTSNLGATLETDEPEHAGQVGSASLWWTWTASASGTVVVDTVGSDFDTLLGVYTGNNLAGLTAVAMDDDAGGNGASRVAFAVTAGTVYQIAVDGYDGATGKVALRVALGAPVIINEIPSAGLSPGAATTLSVTVAGTGPFTYQWQKNGMDISGATGPTLTLAQVGPADTGGYSVIVSSALGTVVSNRGLIVVPQGPFAVTWAAPAGITYGTALSVTQLNATANIPGTFTYTPQPGTFLPAGIGQTLTATFTPTDTVNYTVTTATQTLTVAPATLIAKADNQTRLYGAANPPLTVSYSGFVNNEDASVLTAAPTVSTDATAASVAGSYPISITGGVAANYAFTLQPGVLTVVTVMTHDPHLTWSAPAAISYGTPLGAGQLNASAGVPGTFAYTPQPGVILPAGPNQTLTVTFTPTDGVNYPVTSATRTLTVTPAILVAKADSLTRPYGAANPPLTISYSGFVHGDDASILTAVPTMATAATASSNAGSYPITITGGAAINYNLTLQPGVLTVAPLMVNDPQGGFAVTWPAPTAIGYGTALGARQLNAAANIPGTFSYTPQPGTFLPAGSGEILSVTFTPTDRINYTVATVAQTLDVNPAVLTVSADNQTRPYGAANPPLTISYSGFVREEDASVLTAAPTASTVANASSNAGSYPIKITGGAAANYTLSLQPGVLTVVPVTTGDPHGAFAVTWPAPAAITYGTALSAAQLNATATIPGTFAYTPQPGAVLPAGAGQALSVTFTPADTVNYKGTTATQALTVTPAILVAKADNQTRLYGAANPPLTISYSGFVHGENASVLTSAPTAATAASAASVAGSYPITIIGGAAANYSLQLQTGVLTVLTHDYSGTYFGTFASGGHWALRVRLDGAAVFLAYLPSRSSAIIENFQLNGDGTFNVTGTELKPLALTRTAAATSAFTLGGQISESGAVTGQIDGLGETFTGTADAATGPAQSTAGYYTATALGAASGTTYAIVSPTGQAFIVTTGASIDSASGTVNASGQLTATTTANATLALTIDASTQKVAASVTPAGSSSPVSYAGLPDTVVPIARVVNLSVRSNAGSGDQTLIVGVVIAGSGQKTLLIRGVGPGIAHDVPNALVDPKLRLLDSQGAEIEANDDWDSALATLFSSLGAAPLVAGSKDAAIYRTVSPGLYSCHVFPSDGSGVALAELYDGDGADAPAQVVNISARTQVGAGNNVLIAGFVITGNSPKTLLIRGVGPSLAGVSGVLADPQLSLHLGAQTLTSNDNWGGTAELKAAFTTVGAGPLASDTSKDAALLVTLEPGVYSAVVSGVGDTTGVGLVEIFIIP